MRIKTLPIILLLSFLGACNSGEEVKNKVDEMGFVSKSWKAVKDVVQVPFQYFEDRREKADSLEQIAIALYFQDMREKYPEYSKAEQWFQSDPDELLGLKGNFFKILEGTVQNGRSLKRFHFVEPTNGTIYKYFYETEDRYFILELEINEEVSCRSVRSIMEGWGDQPMFDYRYDENGNLIEEIFQADVKPDLYEKDGQLFFEYSKDHLVNTVLLGPTIK